MVEVLLVGGIRSIDLLERRIKDGLRTFYQTERWFKPLVLFDLRLFDFCRLAGVPLLPRERLFHSGDWKTLAQLIEKDVRGELPPCSIGEWTAKAAATRLLKVAGL